MPPVPWGKTAPNLSTSQLSALTQACVDYVIMLAMQMQQAEEKKDKDIYAGIFSMLSDFSASVETESEKLNCMMLALLGEPCLP